LFDEAMLPFGKRMAGTPDGYRQSPPLIKYDARVAFGLPVLAESRYQGGYAAVCVVMSTYSDGPR
jgi:hypothetical protein